MDRKILHKMKKLVDLFKSKGIKVFVYESPKYYKHAKIHKKRYAQIDSICALLGVEFLNLNNDISLTKEALYYQNTLSANQHLTCEGANAVSEVIAKKIKAEYFQTSK